MIKKILLTAALLVPGLAYGQVSTPLDPPVTPAGQDPTPPPQAAAAGFTTLAYNFDFSQSTYATQSNWLDCVGTDTSKPWHVGFPGGITSLPCNIKQATDPLDSSTVMRLQYLASYSSYGLGYPPSGSGPPPGGSPNYNYVSMMGAPNGSVGGSSGHATISFPDYYIEGTYRLDSTYPTGLINGHNSSGPDGLWSWQEPGDAIECEFAEIYGSSNGFGDGGCGNWHPGGSHLANWISYDPSQNQHIPPGWNVTAYHTYGALYTSDGATSIKVCHYIDNILQTCFEMSPVAGQFNQRTWPIIWVGSDVNGGPLVDTNEYVKNIHVFSCPNWATQQCNGTTLFNSGGLTYWH